MDKPTEHQPLDDFFRRNLNDASVPPSVEGWNRLQGRLLEQQFGMANKPDRRIGAAWYWAASVAAACLLVVYFWANSGQSTVETTTPELATTIRPGKKIAPTSNRSRGNLVASQTELSTFATTPTTKIEPSVKPLEPFVEKQSEQGTNETDKITVELKAEVEQPGLIAKNSEKQPEKMQVQPIPERNSPAASTSEEIVARATQTSPERTLIVSVAEATSSQLPAETGTTLHGHLVSAQEAPAKNTRIANVFRQIKRLKDGEALAKANINSNEDDDESGLFNRLVRSARPKENQVKQQK